MPHCYTSLIAIRSVASLQARLNGPGPERPARLPQASLPTHSFLFSSEFLFIFCFLFLFLFSRNILNNIWKKYSYFSNFGKNSLMFIYKIVHPIFQKNGHRLLKYVKKCSLCVKKMFIMCLKMFSIKVFTICFQNFMFLTYLRNVHHVFRKYWACVETMFFVCVKNVQCVFKNCFQY